MEMEKKNPCKRIVDLVSLTPERANNLPDDLKEHVDKCSACQVEIQASKRLISILEDVGNEFTPSISPLELANRAMAGRQDQQQQSGGFNRWFIFAPTAIASVLLAFFFVVKPMMLKSTASKVKTAKGESSKLANLVAVKIISINAKGERKEVKNPTSQAIVTGHGEKAIVYLSDGTTMWVNHQTTLLVSKDSPRKIELDKGEIFLDVVRQGSLPSLNVKVPSGLVKVVGTKLNISARQDMSVVDVVRGKVIVESGGGSSSVTVGGEAILMKGRTPLIQAVDDLGVVAEWTSESSGEIVSSGFGKLKAKKPGEKKTREQALRLIDHKVKVKIQGRIVRTEVEEEFQNDTGTTLEGIYNFPLPPDAKIAALDLVVEGKWEHGAIVERSRGNKIWSGVIRNAAPKKKRRQKIEYIWVPGPWKDPALLNWKQGSDFELKIFPIPKHGSRRIRIAYTQVLKAIPGGRRYVLPLAKTTSGKAATSRFRFEATIGGVKSPDDIRVTPYEVESVKKGNSIVIKMDKKEFAPVGDIVVDIPNEKPAQEIFAYAYKKPGKEKSNGYAMVAIKPQLPFLVGTSSLDLVLVVDSSYSMQKARLGRAARVVELLAGEVGPKSRVTLMSCASHCKIHGAAFQVGSKTTATTMKNAVLSIKPLGSTRLVHMMDQASKVLKKHGINKKKARIIYLGDGVPTVGEMDTVELGKQVGHILGGTRLTTVGLGGTVDELSLRAMARASGGAFVNMVPGTRLRSIAFRVLQRQWGHPLRKAFLKLPRGAVQVAPGKIGDVLWPGEELLIAFRMEKEEVKGDIELSGVLETGKFKRTYKVNLKSTTSGGNAFLPRMWAERRIDDLQAQEGDKARDKIVKISTNHHVLSRFTSLIVLESPAMAKAFGVKDTRPAVEWSGDDATVTAQVQAPKEAKGSSSFMGSGKSKKSRKRPMANSISMDEISIISKSSSPRRSRRPRRRGGSFVPMRKVWYRVAKIRRYSGPQAKDWSELQKAKMKRTENPSSRERTRDLVRAYIKMGQLDKASEVANHWLKKDRLDAGALVALSGIATLRGDVSLSNLYLASALDVDPRNSAAHSRMFNLYRASGDFKMMCAHAITRSYLSSKNWEYAVEAARCDSDKTRHFTNLKGWRLKRAEKKVLKATSQGNMWERLMVDASWEGNQDVDVVVISPKGRILSWQGGAKRTKTRTINGRSSERLSISMEERGKYTIMLVARKGSKLAGKSLKGKVKLSSYDSTRIYPFTMESNTLRLSEIKIRSKFRYERVNGGRRFNRRRFK
jgi:FecR protein/Vault protein inter-alpha-trypsin domain/von Willebrand factor type A domain